MNETIPKVLLFTVKEASQMLNLHENTVYAAIHQGRLRASRKGKKILIHYSDLERFARMDIPGFRVADETEMCVSEGRRER